MKKYISTFLFALCLTSLLTGCPAVLIGGATVGTLSVTDRRSTGAQADDKVMEVRINDNAMTYLNFHTTYNQTTNKQFKPSLSVISYNRQILLVGLVASESNKNMVERVARAQPSAERIYNYIDVVNQNRTLSHVKDDTWITSKIRTNLFNAKGVSPNHVKVVTFNGVTYVMGILTPEEQQSATNIISTTAGVQKVITLYQTFNTPPRNKTESAANP